jgi:hypothetical protein
MGLVLAVEVAGLDAISALAFDQRYVLPARIPVWEPAAIRLWTHFRTFVRQPGLFSAIRPCSRPGQAAGDL